MKINNEFSLEQIVYLITDEDQKKRIVTQVIIGIGNIISYCLACGDTESVHSSIEISPDKQVI